MPFSSVNGVPSEATSESDGTDVIGVVEVTSFLIGPNACESSVSASVTRTPFPSANANDGAVRSGADVPPDTAAGTPGRRPDTPA